MTEYLIARTTVTRSIVKVPPGSLFSFNLFHTSLNGFSRADLILFSLDLPSELGNDRP